MAPDLSAQAQLCERLRAALADEASTREQRMFGGRSFMVNDMLVVSALKGGDLLVRVDADRHDELCRLPGAATTRVGSAERAQPPRGGGTRPTAGRLRRSVGTGGRHGERVHPHERSRG